MPTATPSPLVQVLAGNGLDCLARPVLAVSELKIGLTGAADRRGTRGASKQDSSVGGQVKHGSKGIQQEQFISVSAVVVNTAVYRNPPPPSKCSCGCVLQAQTGIPCHHQPHLRAPLGAACLGNDSLSVQVRLSTSAPGELSMSTQKYPSRSSWNLQLGLGARRRRYDLHTCV